MSNKKHEYKNGWIGVDFDGTLAEYHGWKGAMTFGKPVPSMVKRVQDWIAKGETVKIVTARSAPQNDIPIGYSFKQVRETIADWCEDHVGHRLEVVHSKDYAMTELWDDRAVQVEANTGVPLVEQLRNDNKHLLDLHKKEVKKNESMKCCGNCKHYDIAPESVDDSVDAYRCFRLYNRLEKGSIEHRHRNTEPRLAKEKCSHWDQKSV